MLAADAGDLMLQIKLIFDQFDEDGDGTIDEADLAKLLKEIAADKPWPEERVASVLQTMDADRNGRIDFGEFLDWVFGDGEDQKAFKEILEPASSAEVAPRWMLHDRKSEDYPRTALRLRPTDEKKYKSSSAYNGEVVEILGTIGNYRKARLELSGATGWLHQKYLHICPEGTAENNSSEVCGPRSRVELKPSEGRIKEVRKLLRKANMTRKADEIRTEQVWLLKGHFLGEVGLANGPKEVLFYGCRDSWVHYITNGGFSEVFDVSSGTFGKGIHMSPQSCKAFEDCESFMFICEAALGKEEDRLTLEAPHEKLDAYEVNEKQGKLSVQCHAGKCFKHEERIVYNPAQCKPVYLIKLEYPGLYGWSGLKS